MISAQSARRAIWRPLIDLPHRIDLIWPMARRIVAARYRGSALGIAWSVLTPLAMIGVFTFLFAGVFNARFSQSSSAWDYALYLFCGLLPWTAFQETLQRSSTVVVTRANLVKRVVFPLETLPVAEGLAALVGQLFGTVALLAAALVIKNELHATVLWLPALLLLQLILTLGASWLVASLGVFLRDTSQALGLLLMMGMYLTPIVYPESAVPERYRDLLWFNPFTHLVRSYRNCLLDGLPPDWAGLGYFALCGLVMFIFGYWWFARTRKNFADVI